MLSQMLGLTWRYLFSPTQAAEDARREETLIPNFWLYILFIAGYLFLYWLKPFDFPDKIAPAPQESLDFMFWFKALILWQPPIEAAWFVMLMGLVVWFKAGSFMVKSAAGVAWAAAPVLLMVSFKYSRASYILFALGSAVWLGLFYPALRKAPREDWKPLIGFMMGVNVIGFVFVLGMALVTCLHQWTALSGVRLRLGETVLDDSSLFNGLQIAAGLWIIGASTLGLRALTGLRLPRAFMAVFLSMIFQVEFVFTLYLLHIVPVEVLKTLLYA